MVDANGTLARWHGVDRRKRRILVAGDVALTATDLARTARHAGREIVKPQAEP